MTLDQATAEFVTELSNGDAPPLHEMSPTQARAMGQMLKGLYGPGPAMSRVELCDAPGPYGDVPIRVMVPTTSPRGTIVYFHGGGWVVGALDEFDTLGRMLAAETGCTVALVDYRLAPENRYPAAAEDAYAAAQWLGGKAPEFGASDSQLILMGDSAGGNLAAVVAQRSRSAGPAVALQVLVYPVTDCNLDTESYLDPSNQLLLSRHSMTWFWDHYAPDRSSRRNADASPLRTEDLSGLPPAVVLTAEHDVLRDEGEAYARRLREARVPVTSHRFTGQMHGFFTMVNVLPGAKAGLDFVVQAVDDHLLG